MAVRKTAKGASLKRWFKEKWTDQNGNACGSKKTKGVKKCRPSKKFQKRPLLLGKESANARKP